VTRSASTADPAGRATDRTGGRSPAASTTRNGGRLHGSGPPAPAVSSEVPEPLAFSLTQAPLPQAPPSLSALPSRSAPRPADLRQRAALDGRRAGGGRRPGARPSRVPGLDRARRRRRGAGRPRGGRAPGGPPGDRAPARRGGRGGGRDGGRGRLARHRLPLPGPGRPGLGPAPAARGAHLHHGLRLRGGVRRRGTRAAGAAGTARLHVARGVLVPGGALAPGLHRGDVGGALPLRLRGGAHHVPHPERLHDGGGADAGRGPPGDVPHRRPAPRPPGPRRGARPRPPGGAQRHRGERVPRGPHPHGLGLHHLAQPRARWPGRRRSPW
jgi:hypothetical protein